MNCGFDETLLDAYLDGELSEQDASRVRKHLETCDACRAFVSDWQALRAALPSEDEAELPPDFAASVASAVERTPQSSSRPYPWRSLALAAACLALVVLLQRLPLLRGMAQKSADESVFTEEAAQSESAVIAEESERFDLAAPSAACEANNAAKQEAADRALAFPSRAAYVGWSEDGFSRAMQAGVLNGETMSVSSVRHLPVFRFDTAQDLADFETAMDGAIALDQSYNDVPSFREATAGYDEAFFAENALLAVYLEAGSGSYRYAVSDVAIDGGRVCVTVSQTNSPEFGTADMAGWILFAEVPHSAIADCESFDAIMEN